MPRPKKPAPSGPPGKKTKYKPLTPAQQLKAKKARLRKKALHPFRPPRTPTAHNLIRKAYIQAGARQAFKFARVHGTDVERLLEAQGLDARLAQFMSARDALELKAAATGLKPGKIALTLPERLVIQWMMANHYQFGGVYPNVRDYQADFFSQYPLSGGRNAFGGGLVADIFISSRASRTDKGVVLAVDGRYWHSQQRVSARDAAQNVLLQSQGYKVARILDTQTYDSGQLESFMRNLLGSR